MEILDYDWRTTKGGIINHFTAIVWKDVKKLGVGFSFDYRDGNYMMYTVARYSTSGSGKPNWGDTEKRRKMIRRLKQGILLSWSVYF